MESATTTIPSAASKISLKSTLPLLLSHAVANEQPVAVLEIFGNNEKSSHRGYPVAVLKIFNNDVVGNYLNSLRPKAVVGPRSGAVPLTLDMQGMRLQLRPSGSGAGGGSLLH
ncbi:uncharacterized protein LOC115634298 isoform X2 [Scaptodrosophila lebanonensis]|nr:uncharacterized protein LOC115634298 isoform X2 [Scaptodrosophila lebanonensis]